MKANFFVFNSPPKKANLKMLIFALAYWGRCFCLFLGELKKPKSLFEIHWPLVIWHFKIINLNKNLEKKLFKKSAAFPISTQTLIHFLFAKWELIKKTLRKFNSSIYFYNGYVSRDSIFDHIVAYLILGWFFLANISIIVSIVLGPSSVFQYSSLELRLCLFV